MYVSLRRDGTIRLSGAKGLVTLQDLHTTLRKRMENDPLARRHTGASALHVVIDADETLPWAVVQWVMQVCAQSDLRIFQLYLGARAAEDGPEGTIAVYLPEQRSYPSPTPIPREEPKVIRVTVASPEDGNSDPRALFAVLSGDAGVRRANRVYRIATASPGGSGLPVGDVVRVVDALLRAGAQRLAFGGARMPTEAEGLNDSQALRRTIERLRKARRKLAISLGGRPVGPATAGQDGPSPAGRSETLWGSRYRPR